MTVVEQELLWALQQGLPLVPEPFTALGARFEMNAGEVIAAIRHFMAAGQARRLGVVFDARRLGYRSVLCAATLPARDLPDFADDLCGHPGITHAYERGWPEDLAPDLPGGPRGRQWPNFWFTLAVPHAAADRELAVLRGRLAPHELLTLPALRRFKIDVTFDPRTRDRDESVPAASATRNETVQTAMLELDAGQIAMVRALNGNLPLTERPYAAVARTLNVSETELLGQLTKWQADGVVRRVALIVRHRNLGFTANGMCVWDVPENAVLEAGRLVAACPEVTHCYQRLRLDRFPFNLYAMIHTGTWENTRGLFERIGHEAGLATGQLLLSLHEYKKTSMTYFGK